MPRQHLSRTPVSSPPRSRSRKILFTGILFFLVLLLAELCCRAYYYQTVLALHPSGLVQLLKDLKHQVGRRGDNATLIPQQQHNETLVRPQLSREENAEIESECRAANQAVFEPWVEFAFMDVRSKYVNVIDHRRLSLPDRSDPAANEPFCIYFLGGSTTYGFYVTDSETIPAAFVRAYHQRYPGGRPIRVINLGMPFYYSYQELILLSDRLFRDEHPDMVIMLDGLNDCFEATAALLRAPVLTPRIRDRIAPGDAYNPSNQLAAYYTLPAGMSLDSACTHVVNSYLANIRHAHDLAGLYHLHLYCFWQPMPFYHYPNRANDPICSQAKQERFDKICPRIRDSAATIPWLCFLGDMLQNEKGLPFVDQLHYSPAFNTAIAEKMLDFIRF
jgi:hypothetical protein